MEEPSSHRQLFGGCAKQASRPSEARASQPFKTAKFHKNRQRADGLRICLILRLLRLPAAAISQFSIIKQAIALNLLWTEAIRVESNSVSLCHRRIRAQGAAAIGPLIGPISISYLCLLRETAAPLCFRVLDIKYQIWITWAHRQ